MQKINNTIEQLPANFFQVQTKIKKGMKNVLNSSVDKIICNYSQKTGFANKYAYFEGVFNNFWLR